MCSDAIRLIFFIILFLIFNSKVYAKDIPIIVISAGKSPQSKVLLVVMFQYLMKIQFLVPVRVLLGIY